MISSLEIPDENSQLFKTSKIKLINPNAKSFMSNTTKFWENKLWSKNKRKQSFDFKLDLHQRMRSMAQSHKVKERFSLDRKKLKINRRKIKIPFFKINGVEIYHKDESTPQVQNLLQSKRFKQLNLYF